MVPIVGPMMDFALGRGAQLQSVRLSSRPDPSYSAVAESTRDKFAAGNPGWLRFGENCVAPLVQPERREGIEMASIDNGPDLGKKTSLFKAADK